MRVVNKWSDLTRSERETIIWELEVVVPKPSPSAGNIPALPKRVRPKFRLPNGYGNSSSKSQRDFERRFISGGLPSLGKNSR